MNFMKLFTNNEKKTTTHPLCDFVDFVIAEVEVGVEVKLSERSLANEPVWQFAFQVHYQLEHLVVRLAGKHDPPGVQFVDGHRRRPQVYAMVIAHAEN